MRGFFFLLVMLSAYGQPAQTPKASGEPAQRSARQAPQSTATPAIPSTASAPLGILKGDLLEWEGTEKSGELSVRASDNRVFRCTFDSRTYFERDRKQATLSEMKEGDWIELVSDAATGDRTKCYARTVHILPPTRPALTRLLDRKIQVRRSAFLESIAPRGNLTLAGIVLRLTPEAMWIRTRSDGEKTILLRQDTRYLSGGTSVDASELSVNTRVFIRASKNFDNDIEAFQVIWGEILKAR
jgi:hypothetical protein